MFTPPQRVLMGPGPSDVPERVLQATSRPTIGHLDPAFIGLMDEIKDLLRYAFKTQSTYALPVSGPGTVGMESCVVNLVEPGDKVLVAINGVFGNRLKEMASRCGGEVVVVEEAWGRAVNPEKIATALRDHSDAKVVAFVHAETSTGAISDAAEIVRIAREYDCLTIVDAVTSLGGSPLYVDDWQIDAVYSGSQKCLSCQPGLSPVAFGERAIHKITNRRTPVQSWFMDINLLTGYWGGGTKRAYHHTAPINALYGLHESLLMLREEGLEESWERHRRNHEALRAGLEALGLEFVVPESERLPQLNAVAVPTGVDDAETRRRLLVEHGLEIGAGLGAMAGKIWRIGLMGYSSRRENIIHCLRSLGTVLGRSGDEAVEEAEAVLSAEPA